MTASIPANSFLVVFADNQPGQANAVEFHTNFRLSAGTGRIALSRVAGGTTNIVDYLNYAGVTPGQSFGKSPDGQANGPRTFFYVTPGASNNPAYPPVTVRLNEWMALGDFIVGRSDGLPTYNFTVVVDDHDMEITHVIRAEEHLTNTHRQVLLYRAMGWRVPEFAHVSLILGQDRSKLSKRHGATSVAQYAEDGFLSDAMLNYLALLGWSSPDGAEIFSRDEAIAKFSLDRVNSAPAVFDPQKLDWLNGQYIHKMSAAELRPLVAKFFDAPWLEEGIDVVKTSVTRLTQFGEALRFVREYEAPEIERPFAEALANELRENGTPGTADEYKAMVERLKISTGLKGKTLFMPLRLAISGSEHGPELVRMIPLLKHASETDPSVLAPLQRAERCIR